jgi:hypothetical protein
MTTVECPQCGTTYTVPARHRGRRRPTFECAKCHHVFGPDAPVADEPDWDDDETWVMDDDEAAASPDLDEDYDLGEEPASRDEHDDADEEEDQDDEEEEEEEPARATPTRRRRRRAGAAGQRRRARATPARVALRSLIFITLVYAVRAVYMSTHSAAARARLAHVPIVGSQLAEKRIGDRQIQLRNVRGTFAHPRAAGDGPPVFVVSATAVNRAAVPAAMIEVQATLVGRTPTSRIFRCSGAPVDVTRFSRGELKLVSEFPGDRPKPVAPGESIRCQTVFLAPPAEIREVAVEVVRASGG